VVLEKKPPNPPKFLPLKYLCL